MEILIEIKRLLIFHRNFKVMMKSFRLITASSDEIFHSTTITLADRQNHKTLGILLLVCGSCIMPPDIEHSGNARHFGCFSAFYYIPRSVRIIFGSQKRFSICTTFVNILCKEHTIFTIQLRIVYKSVCLLDYHVKIVFDMLGVVKQDRQSRATSDDSRLKTS